MLSLSASDVTPADARRGIRVRVGPEAGIEPVELGVRFAAVQVGYWLGWASILVVLGELALDTSVQHRSLLVVLTLGAAAANTLAMVVPWRAWLTTRRGRALLDGWCGGLIAFVGLLVADGGSTFALLLFLAVPFIAVVQTGWRRGLWLGASAVTCTTIAVVVPLPAGATAMRLVLLGAAAAVALVLVTTIRREAEAGTRASRRAELERALAREASHRVKNDLQTAADLLLLGRPSGPDGAAFDETAARIRSIARVHRLLAETGERVDGAALLRSIAADSPVPVTVAAEPRPLDAVTAQRLGIVANELVTNAYRHGTPPIVVRLGGRDRTELTVESDGGSGGGTAPGFGLELVRRLVENGLGGRFDLRTRPGGRTRAEVVFPAGSR